MDRRASGGDAERSGEYEAAEGNELSFSGVDIVTPTGSCLASGISLSVTSKSSLMVTGANAGLGLELSAIAAAVIGGTSLMGGRGSIFSAFIGVLIIAVLQSGLAQIGVSEPFKRVVTGGVIILAVVLDRWRSDRTM